MKGAAPEVRGREGGRERERGRGRKREGGGGGGGGGVKIFMSFIILNS